MVIQFERCRCTYARHAFHAWIDTHVLVDVLLFVVVVLALIAMGLGLIALRSMQALPGQ